ncbi:MAG: helix-turn-helix domain-containing protein [Acidobacteriota bacterium]|nr:helix-turn-helix domain-containing protein [Acidobacteriota bacterium]MDE3030840.1 helix-turn-helix domain-containing protein [Acidobacteriota bacterium]MDE3092857.1 helix-turn-helix domain-containing protein [Acidobacteriota bacterium]MDE3146487.1 helix-turn-helix domain-containing protein [Acidobacteriota bacterium]
MTAEVGALLRLARVRRGISLRGLAAEIGVSPSLISQVETGKTQPSVSTLYALSNFLGISMDDLLGNGTTSGEGTVPVNPSETSTHAHVAQPPVQHGSDNPRLEMDNGVRWERLAVGEGGPVEPLLVTYSPGASSSIEGKLMRHGGFEYAYILEGELTLQLEFDTYVLTAGDSLQFDSIRPHMYTNHGSVTARGVWHVVGRRQQNESLPVAPPRPLDARRPGGPGLSSAVDVLKAMEHGVATSS